MLKPLVVVALCLLAPLGAQALEIVSLSRAARLVDPGNNFFVFDRRSSSLGDFAEIGTSRANDVSQRSWLGATGSSITLGRSSQRPDLPPSFDASVLDDLGIAESWLRMSFRTDGPSVSTSANFLASASTFFNPNPLALRMSLRDGTAGSMVFEYASADILRNASAAWSGFLLPNHVYDFEFIVFADALPPEKVFASLGLAITATPVPEPAAAALMLASLGLVAGAARRRRGAVG